MSESRETVADGYLALLARSGVDVLFGNGGTDFAPIIEAYAKAAQKGTPVPRPILATHENLAVTMAHGYAMVSRKIPAVMVHVSVGTANMVCPAMNAARENVGMLLTAGRSPLTEAGMPGSRDGYIHWSQEMYDQAGLLREFVKWDYELRNGLQLETVVVRALALAASEPRGPVYLSLPREVLAEKQAPVDAAAPARLRAPAPPAPDPQAIEAAAELLAAAERPVIITANAGRDSRRLRRARQLRRTVRGGGLTAQAALSSAAVVAPDESRLRPDAACWRGRPHSRARERRALAAGARRAPALVQGHPMRVRSPVQPHPNPRLSERPRHRRRDRGYPERAHAGARGQTW